MFSDMVRYPSNTMVLKPSRFTRTSVDTSYKGKVNAAKQQTTENPDVTGTDRYKYFKRPVTESQATRKFPLLEDERVLNHGVLAPPTTAEVLFGRFATSAVQTDFRESETQTQPWTPPYVTHGETPEVLYLERLTGRGQPPGKHEVDIVERLRKKRAWQVCLPPPVSDKDITLRYKLMSEMERSDWGFREQEIQAVHEERMKKCEQLLKQHEHLNRSKLRKRLEFLRNDINKRKESKFKIIQRDNDRAVRKLCKKEKQLKQKKLGVFDEYLDHTSQLHAPLKRLGYTFKNKDIVLAIRSINVTSEDLNLEKHGKKQHVFDYERLSKPKKYKELCVRETRWTMDNLFKLHRDLKTLHNQQHVTKAQYNMSLNETLVKLVDAEKEIMSVPMTLESKEKLYQAATLIQKVIQGKAMQVMMQIGRDRWQDTIKEIRILEEMSHKQRSFIFSQRAEAKNKTRQDQVLENAIGFIGNTIGQTLETLAKELIRIKNEKFAHDQARLMECDRWMREGAEGGRRQQEMNRRKAHEIMYSKLMEAYSDSVREFMSSIMFRAMENEAKSTALEYAKEMYILAELEEARRRAKELEPVSGDMLFEFIAPEGLRELTRICMLLLRKKYLISRQRLVVTSRKGTDSGTEKDSLSGSETEESPSPIQEFETGVSISPIQAYESKMSKSTLQESKAEEPQHKDNSIDNLLLDPKMAITARLHSVSPSARFGLHQNLQSAEDKLLAKIIEDMCYLAGALFHTAAKILNKALHLAGIPQESFEEALRKTMEVINEAMKEVLNLILPERTKTIELQIESQEISIQAAKIIDNIIKTAKERIMERRHKIPTQEKLDVSLVAKTIVGLILEEGQQRVTQAVVEDFLSNLLTEVEQTE